MKESRVGTKRWQTEKPQGLAGSSASAYACLMPVSAFATLVRVHDHAIDGTARPTGAAGGNTG